MADAPRTPPQVDVRDLVALAGAAAATYGVWLLSEPAAFIFGGTLAAALAVLSARRR